MIITRPGIRIDAKDRWLYRSQPLENEHVLTYFKSTLARDDRGYYIHNRFGQREELGYLDAVEGFGLIAIGGPYVVHVAESTDSESADHSTEDSFFRFSLDSEQIVEIPRKEIFLIDGETPGFLEPRRNIPVRLNAETTFHLADFLEMDDSGAVCWKDDHRKIPLQVVPREDLFQAEPYGNEKETPGAL